MKNLINKTLISNTKKINQKINFEINIKYIAKLNNQY